MDASQYSELHADIKGIKTDVADIKVNVAINTTDVAHHIKRTDAAEQRIVWLERWALGLLASLIIAIIAKTII